MSTTSKESEAAVLPEGTWHVDPAAGTVSFRARGMFGLVPATGTFSRYDGSLDVAARTSRGELRIDAASLDTGNAKRDEHLRSEDFFDVAHAPEVLFTLISITATEAGQAELTGTLQIRGTQLQIVAPLIVSQVDGDRLALTTTLSVDRAAAGVGWSKMGMIQGKAHLNVSLELVRMDVG